MIVGALTVGAPLLAVLVATNLNREDAATRIRLEEHQVIAATQEEFNSLLDRFTLALVANGTPDPTLVADLSDIGTLYSKVTAFPLNVGEDGAVKLAAYKTVLAEVKAELLTVTQLEDMGVRSPWTSPSCVSLT